MADRKFEVRKREHESDIQFGHTETALFRFLDERVKIIFNDNILFCNKFLS